VSLCVQSESAVCWSLSSTAANCVDNDQQTAELMMSM